MSERSLLERLEVKKDRRLAVLDAPAGVHAQLGAAADRLQGADVVLAFALDRAELARQLSRLKEARADAILWAAYPKLASPLAGDLSREAVREAAPALGLVTIAQSAVDEN
ncbi:MAG: hypothetical protein ACRED9_14710 [Caulobacteraceae bacterium]